jgi:hypothetical protein
MPRIDGQACGFAQVIYLADVLCRVYQLEADGFNWRQVGSAGP